MPHYVHHELNNSRKYIHFQIQDTNDFITDIHISEMCVIIFFVPNLKTHPPKLMVRHKAILNVPKVA